MREKGRLRKQKSIWQDYEDISIEWTKARRKQRKKQTKGDKIVVARMMVAEFGKTEMGHCDNVSGKEKRPKVKAGNEMCSVGMMRRGRNWGDYGGVFCAECPYFIPVKKSRTCREILR